MIGEIELKLSINTKTKESYEEKITIPAFGIVITRNGNQVFKIPMEPGEAECVKILCQTIISKLCSKSSYNQKKENKTHTEKYDF